MGDWIVIEDGVRFVKMLKFASAVTDVVKVYTDESGTEVRVAFVDSAMTFITDAKVCEISEAPTKVSEGILLGGLVKKLMRLVKQDTRLWWDYEEKVFYIELSEGVVNVPYGVVTDDDLEAVNTVHKDIGKQVEGLEFVGSVDASCLSKVLKAGSDADSVKLTMNDDDELNFEFISEDTGDPIMKYTVTLLSGIGSLNTGVSVKNFLYAVDMVAMFGSVWLATLTDDYSPLVVKDDEGNIHVVIAPIVE